VQIMPERDTDKTSYSPSDLTKVWPIIRRSMSASWN